MFRRSLIGTGTVLLAAALLAVSCGPKDGAKSGNAPGQPKHDTAVYAKESPDEHEGGLPRGRPHRFREAFEPARVHQVLPPAARRAGSHRDLLVLRRHLPPRIRAEAPGQAARSSSRSSSPSTGSTSRRPAASSARKGIPSSGQGSEPNSAMARIKQYGLVRGSDYTGLLDGRTAHDHGGLFREFKDYLSGLAARGEWDEAQALARRPGHPRSASGPSSRADHRRRAPAYAAPVPGRAGARTGRLRRLRQLPVPALLHEGRAQGAGQLVA
ncbi:MAG: hypothetical protein MZV64_22680 [Ignavibacteriales bacterium]|nr:hypothetical protein [Ignavibacteriales bacterium]